MVKRHVTCQVSKYDISNNLSLAVEITVAAHDTTGGMMTKISEASMIAKLGIDVYIVKVNRLWLLPIIMIFSL